MDVHVMGSYHPAYPVKVLGRGKSTLDLISRESQHLTLGFQKAIL